MTEQSVPEPRDDTNLIEVAAFLSNLYGTPRETIHKRLAAGCPPEQAAKTSVRRSINRLIEYKGESKTLACWAKELHMSTQTLNSRLAAGWSIKRAFTTPLRTQKEAARRARNNRARKQSKKPKKMLFRRFGRLLVADDATPDRHGNRRFKCHCNCGNTVFVLGSNLRSGGTQSCGCLRQEQIRIRQVQGLSQLEQHIRALQGSEDPHDKTLLRGLIVRLRK